MADPWSRWGKISSVLMLIIALRARNSGIGVQILASRARRSAVRGRRRGVRARDTCFRMQIIAPRASESGLCARARVLCSIITCVCVPVIVLRACHRAGCGRDSCICIPVNAPCGRVICVCTLINGLCYARRGLCAVVRGVCTGDSCICVPINGVRAARDGSPMAGDEGFESIISVFVPVIVDFRAASRHRGRVRAVREAGSCDQLLARASCASSWAAWRAGRRLASCASRSTPPTTAR